MASSGPPDARHRRPEPGNVGSSSHQAIRTRRSIRSPHLPRPLTRPEQAFYLGQRPGAFRAANWGESVIVGANLAAVKRLSFALAIIGSILCAGVLAPVVWLDRGRLPPFNAEYFWMMIAPAIAVAVVLAYQWNLRIDRRSSIALIVLGLGIALYPFWGPPFWPGMTMTLGHIGTILSMYVPG